MSTKKKKEDTSLTFHKINQLVLMPLGIIFSLYFLISLFLEICHIDVIRIIPVMEYFPYQKYPAVLILLSLSVLLQAVLLIEAEVYGVHWIRKSWQCLLLHYGTSFLFHILFFIFLYLKDVYGYAAGIMHKSSTIILLVLIFIMVIAVIYCVMAFTYYIHICHHYVRLVREKDREVKTEKNKAAEPVEPAEEDSVSEETEVLPVEPLMDEMREAEKESSEQSASSGNEEKPAEDEKTEEALKPVNADQKKKSLLSHFRPHKKEKEEPVKEEVPADPAPAPIPLYKKEETEEPSAEAAEEKTAEPETEVKDTVKEETAVTVSDQAAETITTDRTETAQQKGEMDESEKPQDEPEVRKCPYCGAALRFKDAQYCWKCGRKLEKEQN